MTYITGVKNTINPIIKLWNSLNVVHIHI